MTEFPWYWGIDMELRSAVGQNPFWGAVGFVTLGVGLLCTALGVLLPPIVFARWCLCGAWLSFTIAAFIFTALLKWRPAIPRVASLTLAIVIAWLAFDYRTSLNKPEEAKPTASTAKPAPAPPPPPSPNPSPREVTKQTPKPSQKAESEPGEVSVSSRGNGSPAVGNVAQGPCGVVQIGGTNNRATGGNCGPPPLPTLGATEKAALKEMFTDYDGRVELQINDGQLTQEISVFADALADGIGPPAVVGKGGMSIGGCENRPLVTFQVSSNRLAYARKLWNYLVKLGAETGPMQYCSRSGEPDEFIIHFSKP